MEGGLRGRRLLSSTVITILRPPPCMEEDPYLWYVSGTRGQAPVRHYPSVPHGVQEEGQENKVTDGSPSVLLCFPLSLGRKTPIAYSGWGWSYRVPEREERGYPP